MMFSSAKRTRERSRSSQRQSSIDIYSDRTSQIPEPPNSSVAGTKRLFSNRLSKPSYNSDHGENEEPDAPPEVHSEKRHRSGDWPLPASSPADSSRGPLRSRNAPNSPTQRRSSAQKRPSKFVEGSMNDRVSQKPPVPYLGTDEELLEEYNAEQRAYNHRGGKARPQSCAPQSNSSVAGASDASRHSSIFRFGKSIAASFNPSNWKLFKSQTEQEPIETPQQRILRERQAKAEKIYAELKQSGHFPHMRTQSFEAFGESKVLDKHDSGVAFAEGNLRSSFDSNAEKEDKRRGKVFLQAPNFRGESPASFAGSAGQSNNSSPNKPPLTHFNKNPLSSIKRKFSFDGGSTDFNDGHQARRQPSKKDLQNQKKLSKRVSDLEGKLEAARRQLNEALAEPLPAPGQQRVTRPRFVPGALPSLLSERLLPGYLASEEEVSDQDEIGKAIAYLLPENESGEESRGRSRSARPDGRIMPTAFSQYSAKYGERNSSFGTPTKKKSTKKGENESGDLHKALTDVSDAPTKVSSAYVDEGATDEDNEEIEADDSTSVASLSEPLSEVTPKPKRKSTSTTPTSAKKQATPRPSVSKTLTKKRKSLDDDVYKPTASDTGSEVAPTTRTTPRRKAVGTPSKKLQKATVAKTPSPPKRAAPPIPTSAAATTPKQPPSKSLKTNAKSSPSPNPQTANTAPQPTRQSSRKAVNSTSNTSTRLQKPKPIPQQTRVRQSVSPPPSSAFTGLEYPKPSNTMNSTDENQNRYPSVNDSAIPPMPKLPKTVRLPSGEVVNVNSKLKTVTKAGSATSSRVSRSRARKEVGSSNASVIKAAGSKEDEKKVTVGDASEMGMSDEKMPKENTGLPKSDTKASFEWPPDCF